MPVDDYYSLIGVSPDADRDTIRDAYRARRSELDDSEHGRSSAAMLNRAWNVLSDANQRARYDDQLATAKADDDVVVPELVGATRPSSNGRSAPTRERAPARSRGGRERPDRPVRQPILQNTEINGVPLASNRDRAFALATDALVSILIIVVGVTFLANVFSKDKTADFKKTVNGKTVVVKEKVNDRIDELDKAIKADQKQIDHYIKERDKKGITKAQRDAASAQKKRWEKKYDDDTKAQNDARSEFDPTYRVTLVIGGVLALLVFAVPSAISGRTLGKSLRKLRLMKEDAVTPAGWQTSFVRYGLIFGFIVLAGVFLGQLAQLAWIVAIFGVTSFSRNPNRQGWHDRIAHTVVVQA